MSEQIMDFGDADHAGECVVCGKYREQIERGALAPCYKWQRVEDPNAVKEEE